MKPSLLYTPVCVIVAILFAPLLPFHALIIFPLVCIFSGFPVVGLLLAILFDSFLSAAGTSAWTSLTLWTLLLLPLYLYVRHNITV